MRCPRGVECPDPEACQTGFPCDTVLRQAHVLHLVFGPDCRAVIGTCSCGWRDEPRDPHAADGNLRVWLDPWEAHAGLLVAPQRRLLRRSLRAWSKA